MLFADTTLAARIERAECLMLTDCAAAAERRRPDSRAFVHDLAGGVATYGCLWDVSNPGNGGMIAKIVRSFPENPPVVGRERKIYKCLAVTGIGGPPDLPARETPVSPRSASSAPS